MNQINKWSKDMYIFCRKNSLLCNSIFFLMLLLYGKHAFTANSLYDTDDVIFTKYGTLNWLEIGRQGNVLTKKVFGLLWYNPYFTGALCLILFPVTVILCCYLFYLAGMKKSWAALWIFSFIFIASPVWAYQFYFSVQWFEIVWAMFLMVITAGMILLMFAGKDWYEMKRTNKICLFLLQALLLVWVFASYQAFVFMFIALCAGIYLISLSSDETEFDGGKYIRWLVWMISVFLTAFITNTVITDRFFMTDDYLTNQVVWGTRAVRDILYHLAAYFAKCHIGMGIPYSWMMGAGTFCGALIVLRVLRMKEKRALYKTLYVLSAVTVWLAAHILTLYIGTVTVIRSQFVYPFTMAFIMMYLSEQFRGGARGSQKRGLHLALLCLAVVGIWGQLGDTFRLNYTEDMKDKMDMAVAQRVIDQVHQLGMGAEPQLPVVFVGNYSPSPNQACIDTTADLSIGVSCWERVNEQPNRLIRMIENQFGVSYIRSDWDTIVRAREISRDMPAYPYTGYVQERDGIIIIKMSGDY